MMEEKEYIYIIDDNQFGELTNACQYIETGIYDDVIRWVKPCPDFVIASPKNLRQRV